MLLLVLLGVSSVVVVVVAVVFVHRPCGKRRIKRSDEDNHRTRNLRLGVASDRRAGRAGE